MPGKYSPTIVFCITMLFVLLLTGCVYESPSERPTAVWMEDFQNYTAGSAYRGIPDLRILSNCPADGEQCLRAKYRPTSTGSPELLFSHKVMPKDAYTLHYDVYFEEGFDFVRGGKLPGLGASAATAGCTASRPDGWSVRLTWRSEGQVSIYYYDQVRPNACGHNIYGGDFRFQTGRWYAISLHVRVNDPGVANGIMTLYIDGKPVADKRDTLLRSVNSDTSRVGKFLFATFFGGHDPSWAPPTTVYSRLNNFAVVPGLLVRPGPGA